MMGGDGVGLVVVALQVNRFFFLLFESLSEHYCVASLIAEKSSTAFSVMALLSEPQWLLRQSCILSHCCFFMEQSIPSLVLVIVLSA